MECQCHGHGPVKTPEICKPEAGVHQLPHNTTGFGVKTAWKVLIETLRETASKKVKLHLRVQT